MKLNSLCKIALLFALTLALFSCASSKKSAFTSGTRPDWVTDSGRQKMFPKSSYVSVLAWGVNADDAKSKAAAELTNYVQSTINATSDSKFHSTQLDSAALSEYQKTRDYQGNTLITSQNTLYQVQYTVPWYDKMQNQYFCCAYINRAEAWSYIEPKMQSARENFTKQYNNALTQKNNYEKLSGIKRAQRLLPDFYQYYDFAIFIDSAKAASYKAFDNLAIESYEQFALIKQETKVSITVQNDSGRRAYTKLSSLFESAGFMVTSGASEYVATGNVIYSLEKSGDAYIAYPEFSLNFTHNGETIASYNKRLPKVAMYERENAIRRIFYNLEAELDNSFLAECLAN